MAQIGAFTLKDGKYTGTIRTMTINVKAQLVPNKTKVNDDAPDYRLYAGGAELGAAWRQDSKDGETPYLAVKLDDPSFAVPVRAAFFEIAKEQTGILVWNRVKSTQA
ncbi:MULTISPECIES: DUF736 domain-containing protein [Hyphomonas]|uniref:DUF736 domain-containing protein n=1 Tax=Hyphomonas adhaerens TaxID=81029 RepID=A0A3B9GWX3_9PROT|nr:MULTISPECIES: DUF736 domain-containing protein [Hyphomonas]MBB40046.1 hypothetical protein [Hyphomonas sp.]HAE26696.1 DUF736 domain-containing protein [Hyphomonas adhaerens]|tara:strand:- start:230 stop:550 length:321 start_codon:yes stop_codon:yes gene_type:complete